LAADALTYMGKLNNPDNKIAIATTIMLFVGS
jgi:hypothetical protein